MSKHTVKLVAEHTFEEIEADSEKQAIEKSLEEVEKYETSWEVEEWGSENNE